MLEKAIIANRSDPTKALPMQIVLKQSMHCGAPMDGPCMCAGIASLMKIFSIRGLNEPMSPFSSTPSHKIVRSLARSWRKRRGTDSLSLGSIFFVDESCTFLISSDAVFIGAVLTALCKKLGVVRDRLPYVQHECGE